MVIENFWGTKSQINYLERLKQKVDIFIKTKNIFNHNYLINNDLFIKGVINTGERPGTMPISGGSERSADNPMAELRWITAELHR